MDDESGEFMEEAELVSAGRSESKMERPARGCRREERSPIKLKHVTCHAYSPRPRR